MLPVVVISRDNQIVKNKIFENSQALSTAYCKRSNSETLAKLRALPSHQANFHLLHVTDVIKNKKLATLSDFVYLVLIDSNSAF